MKKIAICYDWANQSGGAERVLASLVKLYPKATLFTSFVDKNKAAWLKNFSKIETSFLNKIPNISNNYKIFAPLMPLAFEQFNFDGFDLVISVTSWPAKAIITKPGTKHICYCLTPPRYFWQKRFTSLKFIFPYLSGLRKNDFVFAQRPDLMIATCKNVQKRIKKFYRRNSMVVYPGIDLTKFYPARGGGKREKKYFLIVSRLKAYKRIDLAIKAFNQLNLELKIIGVGEQEAALKQIANGNIKFLGQVDDKQLVEQYQNCQALIMPQEEDFGLTPIEAQACGKPVIAYQRGGALETIIPNKTGLFFRSQTINSLIQTIGGFNAKQFRVKDCTSNAKKFSEIEFLKKFKRVMAKT